MKHKNLVLSCLFLTVFSNVAAEVDSEFDDDQEPVRRSYLRRITDGFGSVYDRITGPSARRIYDNFTYYIAKGGEGATWLAQSIYQTSKPAVFWGGNTLIAFAQKGSHFIYLKAADLIEKGRLARVARIKVKHSSNGTFISEDGRTTFAPADYESDQGYTFKAYISDKDDEYYYILKMDKVMETPEAFRLKDILNNHCLVKKAFLNKRPIIVEASSATLSSSSEAITHNDLDRTMCDSDEEHGNPSESLPKNPSKRRSLTKHLGSKPRKSRSQSPTRIQPSKGAKGQSRDKEELESDVAVRPQKRVLKEEIPKRRGRVNPSRKAKDQDPGKKALDANNRAQPRGKIKDRSIKETMRGKKRVKSRKRVRQSSSDEEYLP